MFKFLEPWGAMRSHEELFKEKLNSSCLWRLSNRAILFMVSCIWLGRPTLMNLDINCNLTFYSKLYLIRSAHPNVPRYKLLYNSKWWYLNPAKIFIYKLSNSYKCSSRTVMFFCKLVDHDTNIGYENMPFRQRQYYPKKLCLQ